MEKVIDESSSMLPLWRELKSEEIVCHTGARLSQKEFVLPQGSIFKLTEIRRKYYFLQQIIEQNYKSISRVAA